MDFSWSDEQDQLFDQTLVFARSVLNDELDARLEARRWDRKAWDRAGDHGLLGLSVPEEHGGLGLDCLTTARVVEAFGHGCEDGGLVFSACAHLFAAVMPIAEHADSALKERVLPDLASGARVGANAITEAGAGSDVFALRSTATKNGARYVLNGVKSYVTNAPVADVFLVYATVNPADGYLGVTAFVVERDTPGLVVGKPFETMGLETAPMASIYLEDCSIPVANRVAGEGEGARVFADSMHWERACLFAGYLGAMQRQLDAVVAHAKERRQRRRAIGKHQGVSHRIADMKLRLEAARLLLYRATWLRDQGEEATLEVSLAKLAVSEAAVQSGLDAIQIFGGLGYVRESGVERVLRDAIPSTIFSGTSEIQRDLVANRMGL